MDIKTKELVQTKFLAFAMKAFAVLNKGRKPKKAPMPFATFCAVNGISKHSKLG